MNPADALPADFDLAIALDVLEACKRLHGKDGTLPWPETVQHWITCGYCIGEQTIYLQAVMVQGQWLTMPQWIHHFMEVCRKIPRRDESAYAVPLVTGGLTSSRL
jgi:hypothetical protein